MMFQRGWTYREKYFMMRLYRDLPERNWDARSAKMNEIFGSKRPRNFFTPKTCRQMWQGIMESAVPDGGTLVLLGVGRSDKTLFEDWLSYLEEKTFEEEDCDYEISLCAMRKEVELFLRVLRGQVDEDFLNSCLEQMQARDEMVQDEEHKAYQMLLEVYREKLLQIVRETPAPDLVPEEWTAGYFVPPSVQIRVPRGLSTWKQNPLVNNPHFQRLAKNTKFANLKKLYALISGEPIEDDENEGQEIDGDQNESGAEETAEAAVVKEDKREPEVTEPQPPAKVGLDQQLMVQVGRPEPPKPQGVAAAKESEPSKPVVEAPVAKEEPKIAPTPVQPREEAAPTVEEVEEKLARSRVNTGTSVTSEQSAPDGEGRSRRSSRVEEMAKPEPSTGRRGSLRRPTLTVSSDEPMDTTDAQDRKSRRSTRPSSERLASQTSVTERSPSLATETLDVAAQEDAKEEVDLNVSETVTTATHRTLALSTEISIYMTKQHPIAASSRKPSVRRSTRAHQPVGGATKGKTVSSGCQTTSVEFAPSDLVKVHRDRAGFNRLKRPYVVVTPLEPGEASDDDAPLATFAQPRPKTGESKKSRRSGSEQSTGRKMMVELTQRREIEDTDDQDMKPPSRDEQISTKTNLLACITQIQAHRFADIFRYPVTDRDAVGYSKVVKRPMDLNTVKNDIENGKITTFEQLRNRLTRTFANAVMFNSSEEYVNTSGKALWAETTELLRRFVDTSGKTRHIHPAIKRAQRTSFGAEDFSRNPLGLKRDTSISFFQNIPIPKYDQKRVVHVGMVGEEEFPKLFPEFS
ncbi:unnamed protein product, partial [Mesorhabditis spiculigera]